MNKLFFDIETLPADERSHKVLEYLFKRKNDRKKKEGREPTKDEAEAFNDFLNNTSFDGGFGRIVCIAYATNDNPPEVISYPDNEVKTLATFWDVASKCELFIGHNIMDFDFRFIYQRSVVLGVKPTKDLSFARYRNFPIFDIMKEWAKWGEFRDNKTLEHIALSLDIPSPKEGIDGSEVARFFAEGKVKEICDYCMRDVETTRRIYKKMTFEK